MIQATDLSNILFLDIETVSQYPVYDQVPDRLKPFWQKKAKSILRKYDEELKEEEIAQTYTNRAAIFAEFGQIVCISVGFISRDKKTLQASLRLKSFAYKDEKKLLQEFSELLNQHYNNPNKHGICGHNIKEFDIPYICRRLIINQLPLPNILNIAGKKPWETKHLIDTLTLWKFGDYKNYTSLNLLTAIFDIPSPKDDIDGSQVGITYWNEEDGLERITTYCEKDVLATAQLYMRFSLAPLIEEEQVISMT
ncbi:MAG TPA: 3'-5' exonuclease [Saprospiraceae bacterium]|nr:3'-5' exonuclease [Saprospiraceae bacterium]